MKLVLSMLVIVLAGCASHEPAGSSAAAKAPSLFGTTWRLVDLSGTPALATPQATISFIEGGRAEGNGSCNRFFGSVVIEGGTIAFGPVASTKMACPEPIMGQEQRYLEALGNATRFATDGKSLSVWVKGSDQPFRFELVLQ